MGGIAALLGGTILGTMGSGLAFFAAPGLLGGMGLGLAGGLAKVCSSFFPLRFFLVPSRLRSVPLFNPPPRHSYPSSDYDIVRSRRPSLVAL